MARVVCPSVFIVGLSNLTGIQMLIPLKKEKYLCYSVMIAAVINMVLNLILIPEYGAIGAAVSVMAAEASILIYQIYILRAYSQVLFGGVSYMRIIMALVLAISVSMWLNVSLNYNETIVFLVSASLFFICYLGVLLLSKEPFIFTILNQIRSKLTKN